MVEVFDFFVKNSPSVSVALSIIAKNFFFQEELLICLELNPTVVSNGFGAVLPVPNEITHCISLLGQSSFASWIARAVGLLTKIPPSCK